MGTINRVTIVGNLGQDPEVRTTNTGALVVTLSVATSDNWTENKPVRNASAQNGTGS